MRVAFLSLFAGPVDGLSDLRVHGGGFVKMIN